MKINWIQKLSSRKFWVALGGFVASLLMALNFSEAQIVQVSSIIASAGVLVAYILAEGYIDSKREEIKGETDAGVDN